MSESGKTNNIEAEEWNHDDQIEFDEGRDYDVIDGGSLAHFRYQTLIDINFLHGILCIQLF